MNKIFGNPLVTPMKVSDYNQNNPKKSDYIKNRPFYDSNELVFDEPSVLPGGKKKPYENYVPQIGDTLVFTVVEYGETTTKEVTISELPVIVSIGYGACKLYSDGYLANSTDADGIAMKVTKKGELVKLDEKFIPDTIARKDDVETTDNKMAFWNEDRISIETYPSSVAVIEIVGKIADDRIAGAIGTVNEELESILEGGVD